MESIGLKLNYTEVSAVKCYTVSVDVNPKYVENVWYSSEWDTKRRFVAFTFYTEGFPLEEIRIYTEEHIDDYSIIPLKHNYQLNLYTSGDAQEVEIEHYLYTQGVRNDSNT